MYAPPSFLRSKTRLAMLCIRRRLRRTKGERSSSPLGPSGVIYRASRFVPLCFLPLAGREADEEKERRVTAISCPRGARRGAYIVRGAGNILPFAPSGAAIYAQRAESRQSPSDSHVVLLRRMGREGQRSQRASGPLCSFSQSETPFVVPKGELLRPLYMPKGPSSHNICRKAGVSPSGRCARKKGPLAGREADEEKGIYSVPKGESCFFV